VKIYFKAFVLSLIIFFLCYIVKKSILFSVVLSINFFIIYFALTFFYEKYKNEIVAKLIGKK
jgi:dolichol kinase